MKKFAWLVVGIGIMISSCSLDLSIQEPEAPLTSSFLPGDVVGRGIGGDTVVSRIDDGVWLRLYSMGYHTPSAYSFWIDLSVQNLAFDKSVGVLWTNDGWKTQQVAWATYEGNLANGFEKWGLDVDLARGQSTNIEYAVFADINGQRQWDPRNNYFLGQLSSLNVKYLGGQIASSGNDLVWEGLVRVKNLAYEKKVEVIYTQDNWNTTGVVQASYSSGNDWTFQIPLVLPNPVTLEFAVSYTVAGTTYWDNNSSLNYKVQAGPQIELLSHSLTSVLSGVELLRFMDHGINSLQSLTVFVAGEPIEVESANFFRFLLETQKFFPQQDVTIGVQAIDTKGFVLNRSFTLPLNHSLVATEGFGFDQLNWPSNLKVKNGFLYGSDYGSSLVFRKNLETGVVEYFEGMGGRDIDALSDGTIVVLGGQSVYFLRASDGYHYQTITFDPSLVNIPVQLEVDSDDLYVSSYISKRIIRWNPNRGLIAVLPLENFQTFRIEDSKIIALSNYPEKNLRTLDLGGQLLNTLSLENKGYDYLRDFSIQGDTLVFLGWNTLYLADTEGQTTSFWNGHTLQDGTNLEGGFGSVITSVEVVGNSFYVADFGNHKIHNILLR